MAAFTLARSAERVLHDDPEFAKLWPELSVTRSFNSDPPGAAVSVRDVALRSDWQLLGRTPLDDVKFPAGPLRWRVEKAGFNSEEFVAVAVAGGPVFALPATLELAAAGSLPHGMLEVPAGGLNLVLTGYDYNKTIAAGEYLIDKFEVTNKEFKEFVDAGGYEKRQYWKPEFTQRGRTIPWEAAMARLRDQTGRPGPSTWEVGTYRQGEDDYPVSGVSWYEAAAYEEFRGKSLPTVYHWLRAAGTVSAAAITPGSNFGKNGLLPVGRSAAVSPSGLFDAAGNVKEWCWNEMEPGATRYILGGAWNEPDYMFIYPDARSPFDRSATNGFRGVKYLKPDSLPPATPRPIERPTRDYSREKPVSDEVFRAYKSLYAYDPAPLAPAVERVDDSSALWRKEKVSFAAAYGKSVPAYLFLPRKAKPPFQTVLYWPPSSATRTRSSDPLPDVDVIDFLIVSGRAVLYPVYFGTYERFDQRDSTWPEPTRAYSDWVMKQVNDARRSLDYLETRPGDQARCDRLYRIQLGIAHEPGRPRAGSARARGGVDLRRIFSRPGASRDGPVQLCAGSVPVPDAQRATRTSSSRCSSRRKPLFQGLGAPADRKKHIVYEAGHGVIFDKRSQVIREALDWFDRYLGPIQ